jgi:4-amino-4-deoxy-L-arabinose transferase-like glycosyltransferase
LNSVQPAIPTRPRSTLAAILLLWAAFYASFALFTPPLLDDADSVHAEVAREMLLRHDYITLHANGIRYLEKAPLFYWAMAASIKAAMLLGAQAPQSLAAAARIPLALAVLALGLLVESLARRMFHNANAGLYSALIALSSFGIFLFTRMLIPDALVCLWTTLALYALWQTEQPETRVPHSSRPHRDEWDERSLRRHCCLFALACALNVLTKGLIGVIFPVAIALLYLLATRGLRAALRRLRELHPWTALAVFLAIAAPWHILAGLANPTQGHPVPFQFVNGHWLVPLPTDANVRGWTWFYFVNEHLLRYLNLRVPHDYDTVPLWLFWSLCLVWLMPWSVFLFRALGTPLRQWCEAALARWRTPTRILGRFNPTIGGPRLLLVLWAALPLLFFSLSTRQEYYVLPALPALAVLLAGWLSLEVRSIHSASPVAERLRRRNRNATAFAMAFGAVVLLVSAVVLLRSHSVAPSTDLSTLLQQHPSDYAMSLGHAMDITGPSVALFRVPLLIAAFSLFLGPAFALLLRSSSLNNPHAANLSLAAGAFGFLTSVFLGLRIFSPVLTSAQLAAAIAPQVLPQDMVAIHGEYESGSSLGFYLQRTDIHIVDGRSSNLWYGSFFPDAPRIFETDESLARKWRGPQRIFLWQSLTDPPNRLPPLPGAVYILVKNGGKEIVSNQPNR